MFSAKRFVLLIAATAALCGSALAQTATTFSSGQIISSASVNAAFAGKQDYNGTVSGSMATATGSTTARTLADLFGDVVYAKDWGAVLNGVADDTTAVQTAANLGRIVDLSGGTALVGTVSFPSSSGLQNGQLKAKAGLNGDILVNATKNPATLAARDTNLTFRNLVIDGNKANVTSSYCLDMVAVDGLSLQNVRCTNPTGDGLYLGASTAAANVCGRYVTGDFTVSGAGRNGVSGICFEDVNLRVIASTIDLIGLDIEANGATNYQRNSFFDVVCEACGSSGVYASGGAVNISPAEPTSSYAQNLTIRFVVNGGYGNSFGAGVEFRACQNCRLSGTVYGFNGVGIVGNNSATNPSTVTFDAEVMNSTGDNVNLSEVVGSKYYGRIRSVAATGKGFAIAHARGGTLTATVLSSLQQGLVLSDVQDMNFPSPDVENSTSHNVWLTNGSTGNRFPNLRSTGAGAFGNGFIEDSGNGTNNNVVTYGRISGNGNGNVVVTGSTSRVELEPLKGTATWDPPSVASGACTTTTLTVTGAAVGDQVRVTFSNSLSGLTMTAYASTTNTDTVSLCNLTGGAVDLASGTVQAMNQKVYN